MKNKILIVVIVIALIVGAGYVFTLPSNTPPQPTQPSQPTEPTQPMPPSVAPRIITPSDSGTTITVKQGTPITVKFGSTQEWTISWSNPSLLTPIETFAAVPGTQGLYTAAKPGTTVLTGQGRPICKTGEMCPQYIIAFTATLVITP